MSGMSGYIPSYSLNNSCERLTFTTTLVNPNLDILKNLSKDEILVINIFPDRGVVALKDENVVGNVLVNASYMDKLISCIDGGTIYEGEVVELDPTDGVCKIKVSAK